VCVLRDREKEGVCVLNKFHALQDIKDLFSSFLIVSSICKVWS